VNGFKHSGVLTSSNPQGDRLKRLDGHEWGE